MQPSLSEKGLKNTSVVIKLYHIRNAADKTSVGMLHYRQETS